MTHRFEKGLGTGSAWEGVGLALAACLALAGCAQPIVKASAAGQTERVKELIAQGADVNAQKGAALFMATQNGKLETMKLLLEKGANPNGEGAIMCPADAGAILGLLGANQPTPQIGTALMAATHSGNERAVRILLDAGADINRRVPKTMQWPCNGNTALVFAAKTGFTEIARLLLERGADTEIKGGRMGGRTAEEWANKRGFADVAQMIAQVKSLPPEERKKRLAGLAPAAPAAVPAAAASLSEAQDAQAPKAKPAPKPRSKPTATEAKQLDSQL